MGESMEKLIKAIKHYQDSLERHTKTGNSEKLLHAIEKLSRLPIKVCHLEETGVGRTVNGLKKFEGSVGENARTLVDKWKTMVKGEEDEEQARREQQQAENLEGEVIDEEPDPESLQIIDQEENNDSDKVIDVGTKNSSHRKSSSSNKHSHSSSRHSNRDQMKDRDKYNSKRRHSSHSSDNDSDSSSDRKSKKNRTTKSDKNSSHKHQSEESDSNSGSEESDSSRDSSPRSSKDKVKSSRRSASESSDESSDDSEQSSSEDSSSDRDIKESKSDRNHKKRCSSSSESDRDKSDERKNKESRSRHKKSSSESDRDYKNKQSKSKDKYDLKDHYSSKSRDKSKDNHNKSKDKSDKRDKDRENSSKTESSSSRNKSKYTESESKHKKETDKEKSKHKDGDLKKSEDKKKDAKKESSKSHKEKENSKTSQDKKRNREASSERDSKRHKSDSSENRSTKNKTSEHHSSSSRREKESSEKKKDNGDNKKEKNRSDAEKVKKSISFKEKDKPKTPSSSKTGQRATQLINGIDSGSGTSFADVLGMLEVPVYSKNKKKSTGAEEKQSIDKNLSSTKEERLPKSRSSAEESISLQVNDEVPNLLKDPGHLEPLDINISSLLPSITPNYRPLSTPLDSSNRKMWTDDEALTRVISAKHQRTKVYSGNKTIYTKVPTLFEICSRILQDNLDALEYTGGVPYSILKHILEKANPDQLYQLEFHNPYLIEDTDELWQLHCQKEFRNKRREELESWREMYMRCLDEREAKLKALTANIKQSQDKSLPVRQTKLAYVDSVVKPPRNIARKQAKNGTAVDLKRPSQTPTERLNQLAKSGEAAKVAVPNPGRAAADRSTSSSSSHSSHIKPKKAPLMAKTLSLLKNRFGRR